MIDDHEERKAKFRSEADSGGGFAEAGEGAARNPAEREEVSAIVEQFALLLAEDGEVELDAFCARQPEDLRALVRERCEEALELQRALRRRGARTAANGPRHARSALASEDASDRIDSPAKLAGRTLGEFELVRLLGEGGMGVVYLAWQPSLNRHVALKLLTSGSASMRSIRRFRTEATAAARLSHPGIVKVFSVGESGGLLHLAMEHIEGRNLTAHLYDEPTEVPGAEDRRWRLGGPRTPGHARRVAALVLEIAEALQYAHEHGVIHRDVKPGNVMIDHRGHPHVLDFGLAKDQTEEASITRSGDLAGTPYYMSPEQAMAHRVQVDHRTDVFSLGVVLYEMLTRRRPFEGDTLQRILYEISFKSPPALRRVNPLVPRDLETICTKALEKDPGHRFQDAQALADDLRRFLNHESIQARPPSWPERARRLVRRNRPVAGSLLLVVLALALAPVWARSMARDTRARELLAPLRRAASVEWDELRDAELVAIRRDLELAGQDEHLNDEEQELLAGLAGRLAESGEAKWTRGLATVDRVVLGDRDPATIAEGVRDLVTGSQLLRDQVESLESFEAFLNPRLSVECTLAEAEVGVQRFDPLAGTFGELVALGRAPLDDLPLRPGHYRIVVATASAHAELTRRISALRGHCAVRAAPRETAQVVGDMVWIPGGTFRAGQGAEGTAFPYHERDVDLRPFWISKYEVTNAEYREYVLASGAAPPPLWPDPYDASWDERPVAAVSHQEARAYAEWAGLRLPTVFEWERAARGLERRARPNPELAVADYVVGRGVPITDIDPETFWQGLRASYFAGVEPVFSRPEAAGPEGLFHTLGNVAEWTDSFHLVRDEQGRPEAQAGSAVVVGVSWADPSAACVLYSMHPVDRSMRDRTIGFRCAKSDLTF